MPPNCLCQLKAIKSVNNVNICPCFVEGDDRSPFVKVEMKVEMTEGERYSVFEVLSVLPSEMYRIDHRARSQTASAFRSSE